MFPGGCAAFFLAGLLIGCCASPAKAEVWPGSAEIEFHATSTLHDFSGTVRTDPFDCLVLLDGSAATLGGTATVAVARMDTRHAKRDANMRNMFEAVRFPLITGRVKPARIDPAAPPPVPLHLTIRNRTRTIPATLTGWRLADNRLRFDLDMTLSLREFGLSPPVILGVIRVGDPVSVRIHVELAQPPDAAAAP